MATNLTKRPFWVPGTVRAIKLGSGLLRFTNGTVISAQTVSESDFGNTPKRVGGSTLARVINRSCQFSPAEPGHGPTMRFGAYSPAGPEVPHLFTDSLGNYSVNIGSPNIVGPFKRFGYLPMTPANVLPMLVACERAGATLAPSGTTALNRPFFEGEFVARANNSNYKTFDADKFTGEVTFGMKASTFKPRGWITHSAGGIGTATQMGASNHNYSNDPVAQFYDVHLGSNVVHSSVSSFMSFHGLTRQVIVGMHESLSSGVEYTLACGLFHGIHKAVRSIRLKENSQDEASAVHAEFTPAEVVAILTSQKAFVAASVATQLDAVIVSVNGLDPLSVIHLWASDAPVGPVDIYQMKQIQKALADGADLSDVDGHVVNGKRLDAWRSECLREAATSTLLWIEKPAPTGIPVVTVTPSATAPFYTAVRSGESATPSSGEFVVYRDECKAVSDARPLAYSTERAVLASLNSGGAYFSFADDFSSHKRGFIEDSVTPWADVSSVWLKRHTARGLQPLANSLRAAIIEPASAFAIA